MMPDKIEKQIVDHVESENKILRSQVERNKVLIKFFEGNHYLLN